MKKAGIRTLCLALSIATIAPLAGCKQAAKTSGSSSSGPVTIHIMNRVNAQVSFDNNDWLKAVEKEANVKLVIDAPPINNYVDRLQIVMASGDVPDIVYNWGSGDANYQKWASDGLLADITSKVKSYSNLQKNISPEMWNAVRTSDGKLYSVPKTNIEGYYGTLINQTWLDKLGLKAPTTVEEFEKVCTAFATQDPDGDGKADTYGFSTDSFANNGGGMIPFLQSAYNLAGNGGKDVDGKYKVIQKFDGYLPYLTELRKLYSEKVFDPEFFTNKTYGDRDKLLESKIGMISGNQTCPFNLLSSMPTADQTFRYYAPLKNDKGVASCYIGVPIWGTWMISKSCKNIGAVLKFLDWGNSKDGFILMNLGVKGVDYNSYDFNNRLIDITPDQSKKLTTESSSYTSIAYALDGQVATPEGCDTAARVKAHNDAFDTVKKSIKEVDLAPVTAMNCPKLSNFSTTNPDDTKTYSSNTVKYIIGEMTLDQYKSYLNNTYFPKIADAEKEYVNYMNGLK